MRRDSVAFLRFDLEREIGYYILGIYFPLNLVVACSWVAFWIVKTDVPARVSLGVTTVLSVTKIGFDGKGKPQVGYSTALDIYIILCFFYTFAALTEFAIVNFIPKFVKRHKDLEENSIKSKSILSGTSNSDILNEMSKVNSAFSKQEKVKPQHLSVFRYLHIINCVSTLNYWLILQGFVSFPASKRCSFMKKPNTLLTEWMKFHVLAFQYHIFLCS